MLIAQSKGPKRNFVVVILALGIETLVKMFQMEQKMFKGTKKSARKQKTCGQIWPCIALWGHV